MHRLHALPQHEGQGEREPESDAAHDGDLVDRRGPGDVRDPGPEAELDQAQCSDHLAGGVDCPHHAIEDLACLVGQRREVPLHGGALDLLVLELGVLAGVLVGIRLRSRGRTGRRCVSRFLVSETGNRHQEAMIRQRITAYSPAATEMKGSRDCIRGLFRREGSRFPTR